MSRRAALDEIRERYAAAITRASAVTNPRIERAFAGIPREAFLPPPPWTVFPPGGFFKKPTSDPGDLYDDVLVVLDAARGVNNGQPSLHAAWLAQVDPQLGETAIHVGAGTGYYTAILAMLVGESGHVHAFEIDEDLAFLARQHLAPLGTVTVYARSALDVELPDADVVYVNAGLAAPDPSWLRALGPGGRLIFPWQPFGPGGVTMLVTRTERGFAAAATLHVGFIECQGAAPRGIAEPPRSDAFDRTRSIWLTGTRAPDATATAVYGDVWFSCDEVSG